MDWIEPDDSGEPEHEAEPVGSNEDLDPTGYDADDDPASRPLEVPEGDPDDPAWPPERRTSFPVRTAAIPRWVNEHGNGAIPLERMSKVAPIRSGYLVPEAAAAWRSLQNGAAAVGFKLTMTGAYRTYEDQKALFQSRYVAFDTGGSSKVWNNTRYWLKKGMAMAAVPGTSNHGWGCAVDAALGGYGDGARSVSDSFLAWAIDHAGPCGWSWEVQSEPWHLRLVSFADIPPYPTPEPPPPTLKVGSSGAQVAVLQNLCRLFQWGDPGRADGRFGPRTKAAVQAMQRAIGVIADGEYGPKTAAALKLALTTIAPP